MTIPEALTELRRRGWTWAAIADRVGATPQSVRYWHGGRVPSNAPGVRLMLAQLLRRERVPKQRRYPQGRFRFLDQAAAGDTPDPGPPDEVDPPAG